MGMCLAPHGAEHPGALGSADHARHQPCRPAARKTPIDVMYTVVTWLCIMPKPCIEALIQWRQLGADGDMQWHMVVPCAGMTRVYPWALAQWPHHCMRVGVLWFTHAIIFLAAFLRAPSILPIINAGFIDFIPEPLLDPAVLCSAGRRLAAASCTASPATG